MKVLTSLLLAMAAGLGIYAARQRLVLALKVGALVFLILLPVRLILAASEFADHFDALVWPLCGLLTAWALLWYASIKYEERKKRLGVATPSIWRRLGSLSRRTSRARR